MIKRNIYKNLPNNLELHIDNRGSILDLFFNDKIDHVAIIKSQPFALRGNHFHKLTTQHILITSGSLEYWYKNYNSDENPKKVIANKGDLISTPPYEVHALKIGPEGNEFIVFSQGMRGGSNYEQDTFRVEPIIK